MAKSLQELRKDAGFRTGRELAKACGFSPSTYARYEKDRETIPAKSAWKMADALGCSIDAVLGRDDPGDMDQRGDFQKRYDALSRASRATLDDFLAFLESKESAGKERERLQREYQIKALCSRYQDMFFAKLVESEANPLLVGDEELRDRFEDFVTKMTESYSAPEAETREVVEEIMEAYDRYANDGL